MIQKNQIKKWILRLKLLFFKNDIHYLSGKQYLPEPLSKEEETELLEKLNANDEKAIEMLITHNLRLVVYISKKFENSGVPIEDLISIGTIGLIKAVKTFRPEKKIKLATYASRCIENEILMHLRKSSNHKLDVSIDEPLNVDWDGNELLLSDVLGSDPNEIHEDIELQDEKHILLDTIACLNNREKMIMQMRYGLCGTKEHTQKEVADLLGISQSYISRLEKKILKNLKKNMEKRMHIL